MMHLPIATPQRIGLRSPRILVSFAALALAYASACVTPPSSGGAGPSIVRTAGSGSPAGALLIVGGGTQPRALVERFVELAGGPGRARIAVFPMASAEAETGGREKAEQLREFGADAFSLNVTREQAMDPAATRQLDGVTGIWFSGGDQSRLTAVLQGSPLLEAIRDRYRSGAVIAGTSAGAAVMSDSMLTGSQRRPGVDTVGYFGDQYPRVARASVEIVPGFALLPHALVDQHFIRRERHNRLVAAVLERPAMIGVGIDEGTALEVRDGTWRVLGASAVMIYDARTARVTPQGAPLLGAAEIRFHLIPHGGAFDPRTGRATLP